ncbi:MAG: KilA-N domain-containing protein [Dinghuibacter sp.]|nr:KilA-N domain-containing protein [Dinghuibacter sp.]
MKELKKTIVVQGTGITVLSVQEKEFISLTDIARYRDAERTDYIIQNWLRNRNTIDLLGLWEQLYNPDFNPIVFDGIKNRSGVNSFVLTAKQWIDQTNAIGIRSKPGRYGGTFAHKDIAFEFASWISVEFKLYIIKEFQRLKEEENHRLSLEWNLTRTLSRINYRIHTDAIKEHLVPPELTKEQAGMIYAHEADVLNMALFGKTAKQWRSEHPNAQGNIRDEATIEQLLVLANMESLNAEFIRMELPQSKRLVQLNQVAITQMRSLLHNTAAQKMLKP